MHYAPHVMLLSIHPGFLSVSRRRSAPVCHVLMEYYNAKLLEIRVLGHAQRCESCEELSLVGVSSRQERSSYLDTGCTNTADKTPPYEDEVASVS